ncbi:MAG TPA: hypothetical protein ENH44_01560 [Actinobacteria bacterium]|nr:hypothetical protein [Actinomycetota bacterium]
MAMKTKWLVVSVLTLLVVMASAAPAAALNADCDTVAFTMTPDQGPAGTQVAVGGTGAMGSFPFELYWESISGDLLASGTSAASGDFSADITIPAGASEGAHGVVFFGTSETEEIVTCTRTFTVTAATGGEGVQPDAYTQARTAMPSTGVFLLPAAGLLAMGAGVLITRRRR